MIARWLLYLQVTSPYSRQGKKKKKSKEAERNRVPVAFAFAVLIPNSILLILFKPSGYVSWKSRKGMYEANPPVSLCLHGHQLSSAPWQSKEPVGETMASGFIIWWLVFYSLALSCWSGVTVFLISTPPDVILGTLKCVHCFSFIAFCLSVSGEGWKTFHLHFPITQITAGQKWVKFGHHRWHKQL